jgi:ribosomal protein L39E
MPAQAKLFGTKTRLVLSIQLNGKVPQWRGSRPRRSDGAMNHWLSLGPVVIIEAEAALMDGLKTS